MTDKASYGKFDKFIHWLMALNVFATIVFSFGMSDLPDALKPESYGGHGASVTTILICIVIRAIWRAREGFPALPGTMSELQKRAAKSVHYLLYICIFAQVTVGILLASTTKQEFIAAAYNINYTSLDLVADSMHDTLLTFHKGIYFTIIALLIVHIAAALKHHFVDKDGVLVGMLPLRMRNHK